MAKNLVIVESPAKAKTIGKYLGKDFTVKASLGHVKDLPKKNLSVDVDNDFTPVYEVIEGKKKLIAELKQTARKVEEIYLAADPDREGEAICFHLQEELQDKKKDGQKIFRVMFNEITKKAIEKAFEKPGQVNNNLVDTLVGTSPSEIVAALFELELTGLVRQLPGKSFIKVWAD